MKNILNVVSVAAAVSVGVLALGGLAAPASAEDARISVADLQLNTPQGRAEFDHRVKTAAERMCWSDRELNEHAACLSAFRKAADENLLEQQVRLADQQGESLAVARR